MFLNNFTEGRIMYMADPREKMVFHLVVKAAYEPGDQFIAGSKIGCGPDLVHRPFYIQLFLVLLRFLERGYFHHVRKLEYKRQGKSHGYIYDQVTGQPGLPSKEP